jgi:adenylyl-sulfate kinase
MSVLADRPEHAQGFILWLTGLSGAGKTTLANGVGAVLRRSRRTELLDGDEVRRYLSAGAGFSKADRDDNVRRIGFVAALLGRNGIATIVAAISPYAAARNEVRRMAEADRTPFVEVHVTAALDTLISRDPKGLYRRALSGELPHFSGISDPYESPTCPDLAVCTDDEPIAVSVERILAVLRKGGLLAE